MIDTVYGVVAQHLYESCFSGCTDPFTHRGVNLSPATDELLVHRACIDTQGLAGGYNV